MPRVKRPEQPEVPETTAPSDVDLTPEVASRVREIVREIETVLVEAPLCRNPPGVEYLHGTRGAHVNVHLYPSMTQQGRLLLHRLYQALREMEAKLANGKPVANRNHAVVWLIEQMGGEDTP